MNGTDEIPAANTVGSDRRIAQPECTYTGDESLREESTADAELPYEPPRNSVERALAEIWSSLLGVERVGVHNNFLLLGGESLLAAQIAARIRDLFGVEVTMRSIFVGTIGSIAEEISAQQQTL
jgi:hypothetical protein